MKGQVILTALLLWITYDAGCRTSVQSQSYMSTCESRGTPRKYTEPPCNLRKTSYCIEPGDTYPKHAVRRFVSDNQGLMKRMYGDLRHLSVLRSEMEWNSVNGDKRESYSMKRQATDDDFNDINKTKSTPASTPNSVNVTEPTMATPQPSKTTTTASTDRTTQQPPEDKGVNACPTRQEVVAPYWAVNTRGKTLAIVNDPPYEQHIHWENCLHENQQMLCREGCRCEQQHRLQRLLAFDPACDCKGIFMDWFLLPSCCICKCYGVSYNFTENVTSGMRRGRDDNDTHGVEEDYEWDSQNVTSLLDDIQEH